MTIIVGINCTDGVIIGADSSATFGPSAENPTIQQPTRKIEIIEGKLAVASTGQIGLHQRFHAIVEHCWKNRVFQKSPVETAKELTKEAVADFSYTSANMGTVGSLVAYFHEKRPVLIEFAVQDFQPEVKDDKLWYTSMGSGQGIADPFLGFMRHVFSPETPPSLSLGLFMATWTLDHTVRVAPRGIKEPIDIAVLKLDDAGKVKAELLDLNALQEHRQAVTAAQKYLGDFQTQFRATNAPKIPNVNL